MSHHPSCGAGVAGAGAAAAGAGTSAATGAVSGSGAAGAGPNTTKAFTSSGVFHILLPMPYNHSNYRRTLHWFCRYRAGYRLL